MSMWRIAHLATEWEACVAETPFSFPRWLLRSFEIRGILERILGTCSLICLHSPAWDFKQYHKHYFFLVYVAKDILSCFLTLSEAPLMPGWLSCCSWVLWFQRGVDSADRQGMLDEYPGPGIHGFPWTQLRSPKSVSLRHLLVPKWEVMFLVLSEVFVWLLRSLTVFKIDFYRKAAVQFVCFFKAAAKYPWDFRFHIILVSFRN